MDFNRYDYIECFLPTQKTAFRMRGYRILEKDDVSVLQTDIPHVSYFNRESKAETQCLYDVLHNPDKGYDQKSSRCDRQSERRAKKMLHDEESKRIVGVRSSSMYGKRKTDLEGISMEKYNRFFKCKEFKRRNKINIKPNEGIIVKNDSSL